MSSKDENKDICDGISEDYAVLKQYVKITMKGEVTALRAVIESAFGHCDDTARKRVNHLVNSKTIIINGKFWKFNETGSTQMSEQVNLLKSLRDYPEANEEAIDNMDLLKSLRDTPDGSIEEPSSEELAKGVSDYAKSKSGGK